VAGLDWFHMSSGFAEHPKVLGLSLADRWALVRVLCWTARSGTNGRIRLAEIVALGIAQRPRDGRAFAGRMVAARLWDGPEMVGEWSANGPKMVGEWSPDGTEMVEDEWVVHDWLDYNPSVETVKAKRDAGAARVRRHRAKRADVTEDVTRYVTRESRDKSKRESLKDSPPLDPPLEDKSAAPPPEPSPGAQATAPEVEDNGTGPPLKENGRVDLEAIAADAPPAIAAAIKRARARVLVTDDEGNA
jgi:hypothetical protein